MDHLPRVLPGRAPGRLSVRAHPLPAAPRTGAVRGPRRRAPPEPPGAGAPPDAPTCPWAGRSRRSSGCLGFSRSPSGFPTCFSPARARCSRRGCPGDPGPRRRTASTPCRTSPPSGRCWATRSWSSRSFHGAARWLAGRCSTPGSRCSPRCPRCGRCRTACRAPAPPNAVEEPFSAAPSWAERGLWAGLGASASLLLLAVTAHITQQIVPAPLLWVVPLGAYLLSFVLCFEWPRLYWRPAWIGLLPVALVGMAYLARQGLNELTALWRVALLVAGLLACCMVCHGEIVRRRPGAAHLTTYYLFIALGGARGRAVRGGRGAPHVPPPRRAADRPDPDRGVRRPGEPAGALAAARPLRAARGDRGAPVCAGSLRDVCDRGHAGLHARIPAREPQLLRPARRAGGWPAGERERLALAHPRGHHPRDTVVGQLASAAPDDLLLRDLRRRPCPRAPADRARAARRHDRAGGWHAGRLRASGRRVPGLRDQSAGAAARRDGVHVPPRLRCRGRRRARGRAAEARSGAAPGVRSHRRRRVLRGLGARRTSSRTRRSRSTPGTSGPRASSPSTSRTATSTSTRFWPTAPWPSDAPRSTSHGEGEGNRLCYNTQWILIPPRDGRRRYPALWQFGSKSGAHPWIPPVDRRALEPLPRAPPGRRRWRP